MALSANTIWELQTGGSDTANSGCFDPSQTAGMLTDGAATVANTNAPVFTSASYNFVAGDVGAWIYIASGANWLAGWYKIASVAANAATLEATIGLAVLSSLTLSTVVGCATVASPTGATWTIDYSQQAAAQQAYTDLASAGAGLTVSSAAHPFGKQMVGNGIVIASGTNFTAGNYVIASVDGSNIATVVGPGNITTGAGASGVGGMGGAAKSWGYVAGKQVASNTAFVKGGSYASATNVAVNVTDGQPKPPAGAEWIGYGTTRGDGVRTATFVSGATFTSNVAFDMSNGMMALNLVVSNAAFTNYCFYSASINSGCYNCKATNTSNVISAFFGVSAAGCEAFKGTVGFDTCNCHSCVADATTTGYAACNTVGCISRVNTTGFSITTAYAICSNCTVYSATNGFSIAASSFGAVLVNDLAHTCSSNGYTSALASPRVPIIVNCAGYNNGANLNITGRKAVIGFLALTGADPLTNAAGGDFSYVSTGNGALLRATGYPSAFPDISTNNYRDIGAAQHADAAGSSFPPIGGGFISAAGG